MENNQVSEIHNSIKSNENCDICYENNETMVLKCCNNSKKIYLSLLQTRITGRYL